MAQRYVRSAENPKLGSAHPPMAHSGETGGYALGIAGELLLWCHSTTCVRVLWDQAVGINSLVELAKLNEWVRKRALRQQMD